MTGKPGHGSLVASIPDKDGKVKFYYLTPIKVPDGCRAWRLTRKAGPTATKTYTVQRDDKGRVTCDCKGFVYGGKCKHSRFMVAATLLDPIRGYARAT